MPLIDGRDEEHASSMQEPAGQDGDSEAIDKETRGNGVEIQKAGTEQRDVFRRVSMSTNRFCEVCIRHFRVAAPLKAHSGNVETQSSIEEHKDGNAEDDNVVHGQCYCASAMARSIQALCAPAPMVMETTPPRRRTQSGCRNPSSMGEAP